MNRIQTLLLFLLLNLSLSHLAGQENTSQPNPEASISWPLTQTEKIKASVTQFLNENGKAEDDLERLSWSGNRIHQQVIRELETVSSVSQSITALKGDSLALSGIKDKTIQDVVRLEIAIRLVHRQLHDEALVVLDQMDFSAIPQPAMALIFKNICLFQLVEFDKAKIYSELLLANQEKLPLRYQSMTELIYADILKQKGKPLSRVASLMSDAGRRQNLKRQTPKVLEQEDEIIKSLDKLINDLEKQKKKMRMAASSNAKPTPAKQSSGGADSKPTPSGQKMKGDVESRKQDSDGDWGDLSKDEKAIAVKNLVRELPPHFQKLMNAYFQKLAEEKK